MSLQKFSNNSFQMTYIYHLRDVYFWQLGKHTGADKLTHDMLAKMHRWGAMKYFEVRGTAYFSVTWRLGQRIGSGATARMSSGFVLDGE